MIIIAHCVVSVTLIAFWLLKFRSIRMENVDNCLDIYSSKQLYPSVQESIKQIIAKKKYKSYEISKRLILSKGGNYFGDLYEVDIKGETDNGMKEINLFVKQAIKKETANNPINFNTFYRNETFIYTELSKIFNNLEDEAGIPCNEKFKMVMGFDESNLDAIILENLSRKGYKTRHRMEVVSLEFAEMSIQQIAKLHGLSLVLKYKNKDYYYKNIKKNITPLQFSEPMRDLSVDILKHLDCDIQNRLSNFIAIINKKLPKYLRGETGPIRCMCHGDFRINNILVKDTHLKLAEAILIDYQIVFFGSPVYDLLYFLYTGTDRPFRKEHMDNLKDIYHDTLGNYLNYFHMDVNEIYSKKVFQEDFVTHLDVGLMIAFYALPFCFTLEDAIPDFSKETVTDLKLKFDDRFIKRFKGIVDDYLEWGII